MDSAMKQQLKTQHRPLCPHLAAAVLWMSKSSRTIRRNKSNVAYAAAYAAAADELLAL